VSMPVKRIQAGQIQVSVWENQSKDGKKFYSFTFQKRYTTEEGKWESTNTLMLNDLPKANLVLQKAYEFALLKEPKTGEKEQSGKEEVSEE